jgi:hypothetical protein
LSPVSAGFLLGLLFDPEEGGDMFLRNIEISPTYTAVTPKRQALQKWRRLIMPLDK